MKIAIIGTGNVGSTLATKWSGAGHEIMLGLRDLSNFKGEDLLKNERTSIHTVKEAVERAEIVLLATPAPAAIAVAENLGNTTGKIIIDAMNIVMGRGPEGYDNTSEAILDHTNTREVVKCFNTTGYNVMEDPVFQEMAVDAFVAGDSQAGKKAAIQLAKDAGFADCYDVGGNDRFFLMEQFAFFWINLAMMQGQGRDMAFKLLKR